MTLAGLAPNSEVEVPDRAQRRRFTAEYKREILRRADSCKETGALGALLRAEGLYSSHLATWRRQRDAGELAGLTAQKRGRKPRQVDARDRQIADLQRQVARVTTRAERAEALVDLQKKVASLLGTPFESDKP